MYLPVRLADGSSPPDGLAVGAACPGREHPRFRENGDQALQGHHQPFACYRLIIRPEGRSARTGTAWKDGSAASP